MNAVRTTHTVAGCGAPLAPLLNGAREEVSLFVHSANSIPNAVTVRARTSSLDLLAERALLLAAPGALVCLPAPADDDFLEFLQPWGLGPRAEDIVTISVPDDGRCFTARLLDDPGALERVASRVGGRAVRLHPFYASPREFELAGRLEALIGNRVTVLGGAADVVRFIYSKHHVRREAQRLGIPLAPGEVVELALPGQGGRRDVTALASAIARHLPLTGRVIIRGASSSSGTCTFVVTSEAGSAPAVLGEIAGRDDETVYLVDSMYAMTASPNIQTFVEPGSGAISLVSVCDQRLQDGISYQGNQYPSSATLLSEMTAAAFDLSNWIAGLGFTGLAGFDFVEFIGARGNPDFVLAEINPRINGATFPAILRERVNERRGSRPEISAMLTAGIRTTARTFREVRRLCGSDLFDASTGRGIFPYYLGALPAGVLYAAFLGASLEDAHALLRSCTGSARP
ncbi:MAG: ATP-grasp domain-containing protein [bacterium]